MTDAKNVAAGQPAPPKSQEAAITVKVEAPVPAFVTEPTTDKRRFFATYKLVLTSTFLGTLFILVVLVAMIYPVYLANHGQPLDRLREPPLLLVVTMAGALGALFSALTRLYKLDDLPGALMSDTVTTLGPWDLWVYSLSSPVIGSIGAVVLYLVFAGQLMTNELFPAFSCKAGTGHCTSFSIMMEHWGPSDAKDYAKALIWGFVAGFSERLIPDTLRKIGATTDKPAKT